MDVDDGKFIGQNTLDAVAIGDKQYPNCVLLAVQTTLVVRYEGKIHFIHVAKEQDVS